MVENWVSRHQKFTDVPFDGKVTGQVQGSIRDGKKEGPWVWYHDNGQLRRKGTCKDSLIDGVWIYYNFALASSSPSQICQAIGSSACEAR